MSVARANSAADRAPHLLPIREHLEGLLLLSDRCRRV
jgi:hypothetical protein